MAARFVFIDHDSPLLLPPDLRDWLPPGHMVHFVMDAVKALDLSEARVNERSTGSAQYPPSMMLGLLIYCYATGTFSSRRIETLSFESVAVRYLCADTHPDHDSICKFRRENKALLSSAFHQVLELAATARVLQVGDVTVSVDGTKLLANASKHSAMSHAHLEEQMMLADSGYYSKQAVPAVEDGGQGPAVYAAMKRHHHGRSVEQLEKREDPPPPPPGASVAEIMAHRLETKAGKDLYGLRKQTVEPVFGVIKEALGFRRFLMRGLEKVDLEWTLVTTSYNLKRLFNLGMRVMGT
jgi:transposase